MSPRRCAALREGRERWWGWTGWVAGRKEETAATRAERVETVVALVSGFVAGQEWVEGWRAARIAVSVLVRRGVAG